MWRLVAVEALRLKASKALKPPKHPKIQKVIFSKRLQTKSNISLNANLPKLKRFKRAENKSKS